MNRRACRHSIRRSTRNWLDPEQGAGEEFLRQATQVKNVWVPMGE
jgi:aldehyde dehydrogenase (NAD+)